MAFVLNTHRVAFPAGKPARAPSTIFAPAVVLTVVLGVAALFATGHPFFATWGAFALFGWLLIMGAARVNGRRD